VSGNVFLQMVDAKVALKEKGVDKQARRIPDALEKALPFEDSEDSASGGSRRGTS